MSNLPTRGSEQEPSDPLAVTDEREVSILVVDDHPENLLALESVLETQGQKIVKAQSGREALRYLLKQDFALILLDVEMPDLNGFDVAEMVRCRKRSRDVPIIFLTAVNKSDSHVFRGYSVGAIDYIFKPFAPEVLRCKVSAFVDLYRKTEESKQQAELLGRKNRELDQINQKMTLLYQELEARNHQLQMETAFTGTILDTVASLVLVQNRRGQIVRFNRACEETSGYSSSEVKGLCPWNLFLSKQEEQIALADFDQVLAGMTIERETSWITRGGGHRVIAWSRTPVAGHDGTIEYIISTGIDVTERKRAEKEREQYIREQVARSEAEAHARRTEFLADASSVLSSSMDYETILSTIPRLPAPLLADFCFACVAENEDSSFRVVVSPLESDDRGIFQELHNRTVDRLDDPLAHVIRTGESVVMRSISESDLQQLVESFKHFTILRELPISSAMFVPLQSGGRALGVMGLLRFNPNCGYGQDDLLVVEDLARRAALALDNSRLYQESKTANQAKDEFLAVVSHELRTPLNSILGWARMLHDGKLDGANIQRGVETIERNARAQVQLIEDLLDISRIVVGKLRLNISAVAMDRVVEAAIDAVRPMAELKGISLEADIDTSAGPISGDPDRLQQVIWNLLSNAIKFTPEGGKVAVALRRDNTHVQVEVSDTGKGVTSDFLPYAFERFRQANTGVTRSHGGLGLGLAIVRHLIELHGGTVRAQSEGEGTGSVFTVDLPIRAVHQREPMAEAPGKEYRESKPLEGLLVLVVDDQADALDLIGIVLEQYGASVLTASSAAEALEKLASSAPSVLICDIGMPETDGLSLIQSVRSQSPEEGGCIPAMALTAFTMQSDRDRILQAGFEVYVPKPVEPADLVAAVSRLTGRISVKAQGHV